MVPGATVFFVPLSYQSLVPKLYNTTVTGVYQQRIICAAELSFLFRLRFNHPRSLLPYNKFCQNLWNCLLHLSVLKCLPIMVAITPLSHCCSKLLNPNILQVSLTNVLSQFSKIIINIKLPLVIWFVLNFTTYSWNQTRVNFSSVLSHKVLSELETFIF